VITSLLAVVLIEILPNSSDRMPTRISDCPMEWISLAVLMTGKVCDETSEEDAAASEDEAAEEVTPACCEALGANDALAVL